MRLSKRGSVLVHVLMTGVVVAIIAAGLMRMTMLRYVASSRAAGGTQARRQADAALNRALTYWNQNNVVCGNSIPGYTCAPFSSTPPGVCNCTCTPSVSGQATIVVTGGGAPPCSITINTVDPMP
jgi:Tfp pilus assembly protein PilX